MITYFILNSIAALLGVLLLPVQGVMVLLGIAFPAAMLVDFSIAVQYFGGFLQVFWPLQPVWTIFIWYCAFKLGMMFFRMGFGARVPDAS